MIAKQKILGCIKNFLSGKISLVRLFVIGQVGFYVSSALLGLIFYSISPMPIIGFLGVVYTFLFIFIYPIAFIVSWWKASFNNKNRNICRLYIIIFLATHFFISIGATLTGFIIYTNQYDTITTIKNGGFNKLDYKKYNKSKALYDYCQKRCNNFATGSMECEQHCVDERRQTSGQEICTESCLLEHQFQPFFWNHMLCKRKCND